MNNNYYRDLRTGQLVFFNDTQTLPPIPVGAILWKPIRHRPDLTSLIGEYSTEAVEDLCDTE